MDIISILQNLKGKVLDAANFDILKHSYELQEENIKQLKTNNEALKESKNLISEQLDRLKEENESLLSRLNEVKTLIPDINTQVSEYGQYILNCYFENDRVEMFESDLLKNLKLTVIQAQHGITELQEKGLISYAQQRAGGNLFLLQPRGKELLAKINKI